MSSDAGTSTGEPPVLLRVVRGAPDDSDIAALVAVLASRPAGVTGRPVPRPDGWAAHWRRVGAPPAPGPGAWRLSARG